MHAHFPRKTPFISENLNKIVSGVTENTEDRHSFIY